MRLPYSFLPLLLALSLHAPAGETLSAQLEQASAAETRADYKSAREIFERAAREHPDSAEIWAALGEHLRFYVHDAPAAKSAFRKSLDAREKNPHAAAFAWRGLGELEAKENRDAEAIDCFKKSVEAEPLVDTYRSLCHLYCRQRKFTEAAAAAAAAVKLNPADDIARLLYAAQLYRAGSRDDARREFEAALAASGLSAAAEVKAPVHCCVIYNAAGYMAVAGENQKALKMLQLFFDTPNHRHLTREEVENDADFSPLKDELAFRNLLDKAYSRGTQKPNE